MLAKISEPSLHQVILAFLTDVDSVRSNSIVAGVTAQAIAALAATNFKKFLDECTAKDEASGRFVVPIEKVSRFRKVHSEHNRAQRASHITSRAFIVSLVSQYDAFLSALVRVLFKSQPGLMHSSLKSFNAAEILAYGNIADAKEAIVDEEIESLLRDSHHEQFAWMEKRFSIKTLRKDLKSWPNFVEITQRRNLFVHTDGRISKQYLKICSEHHVKLEKDFVVGKQLEVDSSYVRMSADTLAEIAVKLTQVLWRKVLPEHIDAADQSLTEISYNLIERKRYKLAINLLDFGFDTIKKYSAEQHRLRMLVNRANAYRLLGDKDKCCSLINAEDWSACDHSFRLASQVLTADFEGALRTMELIGPHGTPTKTDYREWPLFEGFRDTEQFRDTFKKIFGEEAAVAEVFDTQSPTQNPSLFEFLDMDFPDKFNLNELPEKLTFNIEASI